MNQMIKKTKLSKGFTIVELLVVIVVIGILASITIIAYSGITQRATAAALQSDLKQAATTLELYKAEHDEYPSSSNDLPQSDGTSYSYVVVDGEYYLTATSDDNPTVAYYTSSINSGVIIEGAYSSSSSYNLLSAGSETTCVISSLNDYCWGRNQIGQIGNGTTDTATTASQTIFTGGLSRLTVKSIASGDAHTCAIASDDKAYCWGYAGYGALGNNDTSSDKTNPVAVEFSGKTVKNIDTGDWHTCAVASDDKAYCWGSDMDGVLGNAGSFVDNYTPLLVDTGALAGKTVKSVTTGTSHTCAIASDDKAYCWGANSFGQLGDGTTDSSEVPVEVNMPGDMAGKTIKAIGLGDRFTCMVASDDLPYCWGRDANGQLSDSSQGTAVSGLDGKTVKALSVSDGGGHVCVIASDDSVYCWGYNYAGQLGNGNTTSTSVPQHVDLSGKKATFIATGDLRTCIIADDTNTYCWGAQNYGALGNGLTSGNSLVPVQVQGL
jgi:prepilin-type N-terminal cleavage/methylation domain-containing protein